MDIPENVLKLAPWSTSMVQTAMTCPRAFHKKYIEHAKAEREDAAATTVGTVVHKILEIAVQEVPVMKAVRGALELYELTESVREEVLTFRDAIEDFMRGLDQFKQTYKVKKIYPERRIAITKDFKETKFWDKKNGLFRGVLDLTILTGDDRAVVIDHKSGAVKPMTQFQAQLEGYAVMLEATVPRLKASRSAIHFVGSDPGPENKRTVWARELPAEFIRNTLRKQLIQRLADAANHVSKNDKPKTSWLCNYCGFEPSCPAT